MGIVMTKLKFKYALIMGSIMLLDLAGHSFIAFRNKKGIFAKIGYLIIFISFALWILYVDKIFEKRGKGRERMGNGEKS